jgi:hypothetical protein
MDFWGIRMKSIQFVGSILVVINALATSPGFGEVHTGDDVPKSQAMPQTIEPLTGQQLIERWDLATKENEEIFKGGEIPPAPPSGTYITARGAGHECVRRKDGKIVGDKFPAIIHYAAYPRSGEGGIVFISHEGDKTPDGKPLPPDYFRKRDWTANLVGRRLQETNMEVSQLKAMLAGLQAQIKKPAKLWDPGVMNLNQRILLLNKNIGELSITDQDPTAPKKIATLQVRIDDLQKEKEALLKGQNAIDIDAVAALKKAVSEGQDKSELLTKELDKVQDIESKENRELWVEFLRDKRNQPYYRLRDGVTLLERNLADNMTDPKELFGSLDNTHRAEMQVVRDPNDTSDHHAQQIITRFVEPGGIDIICY